MTRAKPAPPEPAKGKGKRKGHPFLRTLLTLGALLVVVLFVLPSAWFGRWIGEPRNLAALGGAAVAFVLLWLVALKLNAKSDGTFYVVALVAVVLGGVLYSADAGSAAVRAGVLDCPTPTKGTARVAAPAGRQCVEVPRCKAGTVPTWQSDRATPTGKCARPRARR